MVKAGAVRWSRISPRRATEKATPFVSISLCRTAILEMPEISVAKVQALSGALVDEPLS
jgi:hypothetical protein